MRELLTLHYSPWSERARWALDHHRLPYRERPYTPMLGELPLRLRLRRFSGRVTVPVLFTDEGPLADSTDIARYADRLGTGPKLLEPADEPAILALIARNDPCFDAARGMLIRRMVQHRGARTESLPRPLRKTGALGDALSRTGVQFFLRKYELAGRSEEHDTRLFTGALDALREALGGRATVLPRFSYADIVLAGLVQMVVPVGERYLRLGPATREVWTSPSLAERYGDLVAWRDALYAQHRALPERSAR